MEASFGNMILKVQAASAVLHQYKKYANWN